MAQNTIDIVDYTQNILSISKAIPNGVKRRLRGTGFENLLKLTKPEHLTTLLTSVIDFYDDSKRCFIFNGNELFFGLEDVLRITGLPIEGSAVITKDRDNHELDELCVKLLGGYRGLNRVRGGISLKSLKEKFNGFQEGDEITIRALALYLIGSVIAPTSNGAVSLVYLTFLEDIDRIKDYAWGAAMLAFLHIGLTKAKEKKKCLGGHSYFLSLFILEHVPIAARRIIYGLPFQDPDVDVDINNIPMKFPLMEGWSKLLKLLPKKHPNVASFIELFGNLNEQQIKKSPYDRLPIAFFLRSKSYGEQLRMAASFTSILCMERVVLHDPSLGHGGVAFQEYYDELHHKHRSYVHSKKNQSRHGPYKKNWVIIHQDFVDAWNRRSDYLLQNMSNIASRRYQAAEWLRQLDQGATESLPKEPSEEEFCLALHNGLILCNVLNKVNPGAVLKVVENPITPVQSTEGAAQSAIQYFENMRNFLVAVKDMQLLTFEASDVEKGGSMNKVVDCILCLKGYYEWKQAGGIGVWRYGGTVKITAFPKGSPPSLVGSESADDSLDGSESSQYKQLLEFLRLSNEVAIEESKTVNALAFLFDRFGLWLLQAYLRESNGNEELPLNAMVIDTLISKIVKDFSALLVSQGTQLGLFLKKTLKADINSLSKSDFIEAISLYLSQRTSQASNDFSKFCICGGKREVICHTVSHSAVHAEVIDFQQRELEEIKLDFQETKLEVKQIHSNWEEELKRLEHHIKGLEVASSSYHKVLEENRMLYNQVQDLKGTIRVYCRVRPFMQGQTNGQSTVDYIGENGNIMIANPLKQGKDARKVFSFNKVFGPNVSQEQIYVDTQPLIRSVLDGFNVCIFAYGQTGSGKTYTMTGPDLTTEQTWGVNYRALRDLLQISKERADVVKYEVGVQMIEIYNEQVRDLLVMDGSKRRLDIRNNSQLNALNVPDASWVPISSTRDVLDLMRIGQKNRAVGATALNEQSSRSHSILTIHVYGKELVSGSILKGCLHLVDLAGSERVDKSEAVGDRLKEAQHINRSLSALGDVISALAQKSAHIPYRNSKLTQVLQDSLGGQAKTLMFVHISPEVNAVGEIVSTLRFAERVASIELGAPRFNKEIGEIQELKEEISNLKLALEKKEAEVEQLKGGNVRSTTKSQRGRAVSPFHIPRYGMSTSIKPKTSQRPGDDNRISEARSSSSGKQRRSRFPSALTDKEILPKMPILAEERLASAVKARSPSLPVRRSLFTDRGALIRGRMKSDTVDNQSVLKVSFSARVPVNKSFASTSVIPSTDSNSSRVHMSFQEPAEQDICQMDSTTAINLA